MALIDSYRNTFANKQREFVRLTEDKVKEQRKISELNIKINRASDYFKRTKSISLANSKLREIERCQKDVVTHTKKLTDIETKLARKEKEILDYQKKIAKEQGTIDKKNKADSEKLVREQEKRLKNINSTLRLHDEMHISTQNAIEELKKLPEKIIVLFLASNPVDQKQLRLDEEARAITEMIRMSKHRDSVKLESCWAVRPMDLLQALNEHNPSIVHFSGHGSDNDEIVFQANDGSSKIISKEAIVQTMMASSDGIKLVFFNTCYSYNQAEAVSLFVDATIGMNTSIGDEAARIFSSQFYSSIGFGNSVQKAFEQAKALLMLENVREEDTPELFVREGLNPNEIYIVKPNDL